jgi:magnesium and cobalt transporter
MEPHSSRPTFLERLSALLTRKPEDHEELIELLHAAYERNLFDADALSMIEGAIQVSDIQVREVMVPRAQMDVLHADDPIERIVAFAVETSHSRFPVVGEDKDDVLGILLAKDLLLAKMGQPFQLHSLLRPAVFIPESKRLNVLLREFRVSHNHMAIVVDEYGGVSGLVTIEDVLEQIVGDIEDEYDFDEDADNIIEDQPGRFRVKATTEVDSFNEVFGCDLVAEGVDTIGGLVSNLLGRMPSRGETVRIGEFRFHVLRADSRRLHTLLVERAVENQDAPALPE